MKRRGKGHKPTMVHVSTRVPAEVAEYFSQFEQPTAAMREVLVEHVEMQTMRALAHT
jgi:hypothetical protein